MEGTHECLGGFFLSKNLLILIVLLNRYLQSHLLSESYYLTLSNALTFVCLPYPNWTILLKIEPFQNINPSGFP